MKKRLTFIFILAASTVTGILIFQGYWVYTSYVTAERNFNNAIMNALQNSLDAYPLKASTLPASLGGSSPYLSVIDRFYPTVPPQQNEPANPQKKKDSGVVMKFDRVPVSSANLVAVEQLVARLLAESSQKPLDMAYLTSLFNSQLTKNHIVHPFKLILLKNQANIPAGEIAAYVNFSRDKEVVKVEITDASQYLLTQNIAPAMLSVLLILLSAGSLFYMGLVIRRQVQLDGIKNDFINNVTHELRTPISILKSSHESLLHFSDLSDTDKIKRHLYINVDILDKLDKNVDRILDITRYEQGMEIPNYEPINIDKLMADIINRFSATGGHTMEYQTGLTNKLVTTDGYIIDTIVTNLIDNAIKYGNMDVNIRIATSTAGSGWQLQVSDNGIGISDQNLPYIFDKFYRVPSGNRHDVKGYGLGLSYVKLLVNNLKGTIAVKSRLGAGTTFTIKFKGNEQD